MKISVLLIEDEEFDVQRIRRTINPFKHRIIIEDVVASGISAVELLEKETHKYDVIIMDYQIAGGLMGENLIRRIKEINPLLQIIVVTKMTINMTDYDFANRMLEAGATWYCTKYPGDIEEFIYQPTDFILNIFNAWEKKKLETEKIHSKRQLQQNIDDILNRNQIIGRSKAITTLKEQIRRFAGSDVTVIIRGPSGTGKELVATHIHYHGKRKFENFIPINCGSLPDNLIESELFGFEKGSFTGANKDKLGLFEVANRGTVFLDEITELPYTLQSTLLRVIQEGEIDKIGRTKKVEVKVRIIAATNKDLENEVREKRFREDLYYRLNVVSIPILPLEQRKEDIPLLIDHFMSRFGRDMNKEIPEIYAEGYHVLSHYKWPGNVRELQNVVQRLLFLNKRRIVEKDVYMALGVRIDTDETRDVEAIGISSEIIPWRDKERRLKRQYFEHVRQHTSSDAEAARKLGLAPPNYYRMCKELGIK